MEQERSDHPSADFVCDGAPHITFSDARFHTQPAPQNMCADRAAAPSAGGPQSAGSFRGAKKQKKNPRNQTVPGILAAGEGFEPSQTESESGVLPLHKPAISLRGTSRNEQILLYKKRAICQPLFPKKSENLKKLPTWPRNPCGAGRRGLAKAAGACYNASEVRES